MKKTLYITTLMASVAFVGNAWADDFTYYTEGPYAGLRKSQEWSSGNNTYHVEYTYEGNTRTSTQTINGVTSSSSIYTYKESIAYYVSQATQQQFQTHNVLPNDGMMYRVSDSMIDTNTIGGKGKYMQTFDENGNSTGYVNASFDANGNITGYGGTINEPFTNLVLDYENGKPVSQMSMLGDYGFIYDEETGKPVSKSTYYTDWIYDEATGTYNEQIVYGDIVETYDFTTDGKLKVCDANGSNCTATQYSSLDDYLLAPFAALNLTDVFDSDFGTKGYVPSRLQEKHADGSITIYNEDGTFKGFKNKRIYTLDEANKITGTKNRVSIKYK